LRGGVASEEPAKKKTAATARAKHVQKMLARTMIAPPTEIQCNRCTKMSDFLIAGKELNDDILVLSRH
jgi:hypothetical protein